MKRLLTMAAMFLCSMVTSFAQYGGFGAKSKRGLGGMRFFFTLLLSMCFTVIYAEPVTEQQALQKAQNFFKDKQFQTKNVRRAARAGQQQSAAQEDFYIFNVEDNGGFVIVSGDDRTEEILGYSDNGHIDLDNIPENVREWFDSYSKQIKALDDMPEVQKVQRSDKPAIAPLIKTQWGQGDPYNRMCPAIDGSHCLTGCGATAMAQIVYYWRDYIKNVYTIPGYVTYREKIDMPELPSTELDWDKMQQSFSLYYQPRTDESKDAVAKLMLYCGQSVGMDYGLNESGGGPSGGELVKYFGFSENLKIIYRDKYSHIWEDIIYKELSAERPVYYEGSTYCQRHAFICDGYDGEGRFHINWGWNGDCDGFFKLSLYGNYSSSHSAIIGIRPSSYDEKTESFPIANCILDVVKQAYNRSSLDNDFVGINISGKVTTSIDIPNIEYAWSLYSDNEQIKVFDTISGIGKANESQILNSTIDFGSGITSGKYQLRLICRINRESDWILVGNSDDCYIIEIDGNSLYTRGVKNDFEITGIEYLGKFLRNHDIKMKISIKNNGETYYWPFYIKDDKETLFKITAYILPGQSDDIVVDYRPQHNGKIKIMISDNPNFSGNLCYEDEIEIGEAPEQDLQLNLSVRGARNNTVSDTELDVDVKIKNVGTITFDDDIIFTYEIGFNEEKHPVRIEPGDSAILSFHVDNLTKGKIYNFIVLYYKNSDIYRMGQSVECLVGFDLFESHLEAKINVKNPLYDAKNNIIYDTYPELELEVKNNDDYEYIDKIYFNWFHWLNEKGSGPGVVGEPHDVYLKGGERIKIPIVFRDKETPWDVYTVQASYVSERVEKNFFPDFIWYTMKRELPVSKVGMDFVELNADEPREVDLCLDISGLKCTNLEFDMQLPDGVELETNDDNSIYYVPGPIVKEMDAICKEGNLYHFVMTMTDTWENQESSQSFVKVRIRLVDKLYHGIYNVLFSNVECRYLEREFPCEEIYSKIKVVGPITVKTLTQAGTLSEVITNEEKYCIDELKIIGEINGSDLRLIRDMAGNNYLGENTDGQLKRLDLSEAQIVVGGERYLDTGHIRNSYSSFHFNVEVNDVLPQYVFTYLDLESVKLPENIKEIGDGAFQGCQNLQEITISNSVTSIGINVFGGCSGLTSVTIPNSVTSIGEGAFADCSGLTSVTIPNSVTSIGYYAFAHCSGLTSITIGSGIKKINNSAFAGCPELTDVTCKAASVPNTSSIAFADSPINNATLHVPGTAIDAYKTTAPWSGFKSVEKIVMPTHRLTYIVDEEEYKSYEIEEGATITPEAAPTKEGYTFSGWSEIPETMPAHDVTVIGTFTINKYKLTYTVDGVEYKSYEVEYGASIIPEAALMKEGYTFSGWSEIPETMPAHDVTVTGTFSINKYKLTYTVDGVEYKSYEVEYGASIIPEAALMKEGYTFSGWSEIPETMPAHDVTVTGTFSINKYNLTYKVDGEVYKSYDVEYGAKITLEPDPTKEGYTFSGWSEIPATMPAHDVTVTGTFSINKYKLTYTVDGEEYKFYNVEYDASITPEPAPTKEGYTFSGWSEIPETMPAHDVTVTGSFSINSYTLTYMIDDKVYKTVTYEYGATITPEPAPTKEGYTFSGWSEILATMPAHDVTVTGSFSINKYKLTYTVDGEEYKSYEVEYGATITPESAPTKEGYTFSGWSEIPETMPAHDVTITGTFSINSYKLTYMIDDKVYKETMYEYGATITPEPQPEGDYVEFTWVGLPDKMPAHDVTVTASYVTGIMELLMAPQNNVRIYSPNGKKLDKPQKGLNIVVFDDGTVKKVVVK